MLLLMCWTNPQEELTLNSKLSEKFPTSGPNFARYIYTLYTIDYTVLVLVVCTWNTFRNTSVWFVLCGAEFLDLNLSFAYPSARFFSAFKFANVFADFFFSLRPPTPIHFLFWINTDIPLSDSLQCYFTVKRSVLHQKKKNFGSLDFALTQK